MMYTTLNKIRSHSPCTDGWAKLLAHIGKTGADDEPLGLDVILASNGLDDALWCLRAVDGHEDAVRKLACDYALMVEHLWDMPDVVRQYLTTQDATISDAAWDAASDAAWAAASDAAWDAAWDAARVAARAAAWVAARAATRAAAWAEQTKMFTAMIEAAK